MAAKTNGTVILLPLYPQYAKDIMAGKKTVEFRKANVPRNLTHVVVYATAPEKKILGYFSVRKTVEASAATLWRRFGRDGQVSKRDFDEYYTGGGVGIAILVDCIFRFRRPVSVDLNGSLYPIPQSFKYLSRSEWRRFSRRRSRPHRCQTLTTRTHPVRRGN
jgi:predicted transcriptional regulator